MGMVILRYHASDGQKLEKDGECCHTQVCQSRASADDRCLVSEFDGQYSVSPLPFFCPLWLHCIIDSFFFFFVSISISEELLAQV
jgi:hypothetical protein